MTAIAITGMGLTGVLRITWVRDNLAHVLDHSHTDETSGTWTGLACPGHGLALGTDVDDATLQRLAARSEIADLIWEAPDELTADHAEVFQAAMRAHHGGDSKRAEQLWEKLQAIWSQAWSANYRGKFHVWGRAPHVRHANPVGGCPPQFAHRVVSSDGETPKIAASRLTSWVVNPRCLPSRRPSAAHTVELLGQPISSPSIA